MIIELPPTTLVNRIVPKDRFKFTDATKINRIRWVAKLAANTLNISTPHLLELEIFAVDMPEFDQTVLIQIQEKIPHCILFIVNDDWIGMLYQNKLYGRVFQEQLTIQGLDLDAVREHFIRQILNLPVSTHTLTEQINQYEQAQLLRAQIHSLNNSIKREKQLNKKQALARQRYTLEQQLSELGE